MKASVFACHRSILPGICLLLLLSGCSLMPEQTDYDAVIAAEQQQLPPWPFPQEAVPAAQLTDLIDSADIHTLLQTAFSHHPGLQQTLLTLQIREKQLTQASAQRRPAIQADLGAGTAKDSSAQYQGNLNISWEIDLWGRLADLQQAAELDVLSQSLLYQSAQDSLAAEVIRNWLTLIAQSRAIDIESQRLASLKQTERFILQRYRQGLGVLEDLDSARTAVASSEARLEALTEDQRQQHIFLRTVLGISQSATVAVPADYPDSILPLADLPEQTLARRPDLRAAYVTIQAAQATTHAAYKDLLPRLNLQFILQDTASSPRAALFSAPAWSLLGQLTAPIYEGGQRRAAAEITELETAIRYQQYREVLLAAVTEVEQALSLETALARQQTFIESAVRTAENNLLQYQTSYRSGLRSILDLLLVQQQTYDLQAQLDTLIFQRLLNRINLGLALGLEARA